MNEQSNVTEVQIKNTPEGDAVYITLDQAGVEMLKGNADLAQTLYETVTSETVGNKRNLSPSTGSSPIPKKPNLVPVTGTPSANQCMDTAPPLPPVDVISATKLTSTATPKPTGDRMMNAAPTGTGQQGNKPPVPPKGQRPSLYSLQAQVNALQTKSDQQDAVVINLSSRSDSMQTIQKVQEQSSATVSELSTLLTKAQALVPLAQKIQKDIDEVVKVDILDLKKRTSSLETKVADQAQDIQKLQHTPNTDVNIQQQIDSLNLSLQTLKASQQKAPPTPADAQIPPITIPAFPQEFKALREDLEVLQDRVEKQETSVRMLAAWADILYKDLASQQEQVQHNSAKAMQTELILGGVRKFKQENCIRRALQFLREKAEVDLEKTEVLYAYRRGVTVTKFINGAKIVCPPQMIIRVTPQARDLIMQNAKKLKGKVDPEGKYKYFIFPHLPESFRAARQKYRKQIADIQQANEKISDKNKKRVAKVVGTKLFIDNVFQKQLIRPPTPSEVVLKMMMHGDELAELNLLTASSERTTNRPAISEHGNHFFGYALRASRLETVEKAYVQVRSIHPYARHISLAYKVAQTTGSCDDGEYFGDLTMMEAIEKSKLDNIMLFVVRIPSERQLGPKRFDIIRKISEHLLQKVKDTSAIPMDTLLNPEAEAWMPYSDEALNPSAPTSVGGGVESMDVQSGDPSQANHQ